MPWRINGPLLDVAAEVFVKQDRHEHLLSRLSLPRHQDLLSPPKLDEAMQKKLEMRDLDSEDMKEYNQFLADKTAFNQFKAESYSLWCDALYRISIANHFR